VIVAVHCELYFSDKPSVSSLGSIAEGKELKSILKKTHESRKKSPANRSLSGSIDYLDEDFPEGKFCLY